MLENELEAHPFVIDSEPTQSGGTSQGIGASLVLLKKSNTTVYATLAVEGEMNVVSRSQGPTAGYNKTGQALLRLADAIGLVLPTDNPAVTRWIEAYKAQNKDGALIVQARIRCALHRKRKD